MDDKIAEMKKIFTDLGGDEAAWEHIEFHIKQAVSVKEVAAEEVKTDAEETKS